MPRLNLRQGLDRDVYAVIAKLEETNGGPFKSAWKAYDAIKHSNSHLSRSKKRPLEDSIERVLEFRKEELEDDDDDSDAAIEEAEERMLPMKTEDERFLLNRQMTKHWNTTRNTPKTTDGQPDAKKRRLHEDGAERSGTESVAATTPKTNGNKDGEESAQKPKKASRPNRFNVEQPQAIIGLGGMADVEKELTDHLLYSLKPLESWTQPTWEPSDGVLLTGPVGVGKRTLVRKVAADHSLPIVSIAHCLNETDRLDKSLTEAFDEAMRLAPSIVLLEDVHFYLVKPGSSAHNEQHNRIVMALEKQRKRMAQESQPGSWVCIIGTCPTAEDIAPAAFPHGVFSDEIKVKIPDLAAREDIFRVRLENRNLDDDVDLHELARMTHGHVGDDIRRVIVRALRLAGARQRGSRQSLANLQEEENDDDDDMVDGDQPSDLCATMEDFRQVIKTFVPSLRKEGFTVIPSVSWDQVGAMEVARKQLQISIIGPIKNPDLYETWGLNRPGGVILWGPPGCGKTLVAQAVANEAQASFILINGPELLNKYVGESERAVRELFQRARSSKPCILFFDEMDSLVPRRSGGSSDAGVRVVNALLTELDGVQDRSGVYVIGTTNRPDMIDPAMLRPGRLSVRIMVDLPTEDERVDILHTIYRNRHSAQAEDHRARIERVARDRRCKNFSGADLMGLHQKAAEHGLMRTTQASKIKAEVTEEDWEYALKNSKPSVTDHESYRKLARELGRDA
ncbi:P-loop containing nucleoside triphosphate hydrolase protein [Emericellopsis atlantica]|uniref:Peroxisomal ATPase PEX1 n=1 Tax=Emericellopsis atlantica TaxID=2614577 RepID=A0A9P7ZSP7_9HYPO|nr:P-loop containing nucleoside triphosphate hydrolase protein [Emericellopsis atlantica]KAG9257604.1 P-loop containing nucleoside triphosphate hydrolase protein [Emericellopsis atlantica]